MRSTRAPFPSPNTAATSAFVAADTGSTSSTSAGESCSSLDSKPAAPAVVEPAYRTSPALASTAASPMRVDVAPSNDSATQSKTPWCANRRRRRRARDGVRAAAGVDEDARLERACVQTDELPLEQTALAARLAVFIDVLPAAFSAAVSVWRITPLVAGVHEAAHVHVQAGHGTRR